MSSRFVFFASLLGFAASLVVAAALLPSRVPMHFNAGGDVDRWAGRGESLVVMGVIGGGLALLFGALAARIDRLPIELVNAPYKQWWTATPERIARLRSRLATDLYVIGAATLVLLAAVELLTVRAALLDRPHLDGWFWVVFVTYACFVALSLGYAVAVRYRPERA